MFDTSTQIYIPNNIDDILSEYNNIKTEDSEFLDSLFSYEKLNNIDKPNVLSLNLFYKDVDKIVTNGILSEDLIKKEAHNEHKNKWTNYFQKILDFGPQFIKDNPDKKIRIYLDPECDFMVDRLLKFCEVFLMKKTSLSAQPGAMWRMLAFQDDTVNNVVCWDADNMHIYKNSYVLFNSTAPFSKIYNSVSSITNNDNKIIYRFIQCGLIGANIKIPIEKFMKAFIYYDIKNKIKKTAKLSSGEFEFFGSTWPFYGFDEWFTHNVLLPITQKTGINIYVPRNTFYKITLNEFMLHEFQHKNNTIFLQ